MSKRIIALAIASIASSATVQAEDQNFAASLEIMAPISIQVVRNLEFESTFVGHNEPIVTAPNSAKAAVFAAQGAAGWEARGYVVQNSIIMTTGNGQNHTFMIPVDRFSYGGDMDYNGRTQFDHLGKIDNLRVGATAHVTNHNVKGFYQGTATFRLCYL